MTGLGAEPGQKVSIDANAYDDLTPDQLGRVYEIDKATGTGDDRFVRLKDDQGVIVKHRGYDRWFRATELLPARAELKPGAAPRVVTTDAKEQVQMSVHMERLINLSNELHRGGMSLRDATIEASRRLEKTAEAYLEENRCDDPVAPVRESALSLANTGLTPGQVALGLEARRVSAERGISQKDAVEFVLRERFEPRAVVSLRALPGENYFELTSRIARERGLTLADASRACAAENPGLAELWASGRAL
jgi:hypothetical protein